ncbi:hypothetical protein HYALB_00007651 [Hymenoscyphus albidus]|uniref:Uncharacterized protein n=1 Tax=Hymenoscyphus albidus TaxID=595503 RepID=A0A9N9Q145_9HELO|nr:hypothetical protein HYALB_00007651 [Hymenoscyphus albidus]
MDWEIFQDLEQKYRDIYGAAPRLQNGDYFAEKGQQRRQLRAFEWVTKMTVAPSRCGKKLAIYRMQGHPMIPDLSGGEDVRRVLEELEGDIRRDVLALLLQLEGMLVRT